MVNDMSLMKDNEPIERESIKKTVIMFSIYLSLMLFQTNYFRLGTLSAFVTIVLTLLYAYNDNIFRANTFRISNVSCLVIIYFISSTVVSICFYGIPGNYVKFAAQILLFLVLKNYKVNYQESKYITFFFVLSSTIYSVLILRSASIFWAHSMIRLFGTTLDPNYVGIPVSACSVVALHYFLVIKKHTLQRMVFAGIYLLILYTIIATASRGTLLSFLFGNVAYLVLFINNRRIKIHVRIFLIILILSAAVFAYRYFSTNYLYAWNRITNFGAGSDNGRLEIWKWAIDAWKTSPVFGIGIQGMYGYNGFAIHNTYIQMLCESGIFGCILVFPCIIELIRHSWRIGNMYFCIVLGILVQIMFLDANDNRCLWVIFTWIAMVPPLKSERGAI